MLDSTFFGSSLKETSYSLIVTYHDDNKIFRYNYFTYEEALDEYIDKCQDKARLIAVLGSGEVTIILRDNSDDKVVRYQNIKSETNL